MSSYDLTPFADVFTGTSGDDTVNATSASSLNPGDHLDGVTRVPVDAVHEVGSVARDLRQPGLLCDRVRAVTSPDAPSSL